jgi:ATP/maltotriose-dependent transcriptional regulator MalT
MTAEVAATRPLTAKVLPPERPDGLVRRHDLLERLDGALRCRLTTIVAGAGYGKSTLAASWARAPACVWLTCDRADRSLGTFAGGLAELPAQEIDSSAGESHRRERQSRCSRAANICAEYQRFRRLRQQKMSPCRSSGPC